MLKLESLRRQMERLEELYEFGECVNNEWYSVGMVPPEENVVKLRAIARKLNRIYRQLGTRGAL